MIHSYHVRMTRLLRSLWTAPGALPPPPRRAWWDWALVSAVIVIAVLEGMLRVEVRAPLPSAITVAVLAPTLLWRRRRPLPMLSAAFITLGVVALLIGGTIPLYACGFLLLLPYSLFRWGTGRAITLGVAVIVVYLVLAALADDDILDILGSVAVALVMMTLGVALRYRASARMRELDQLKLLEREQLARDLHDTVAHHVSAIAIRAQAGLATAAGNPDAATGALEVIEAEASRTLAEMRSMVRLLRRGEAADMTPGRQLADIEQLASADRGGPSVAVHITGDADLPPAVAAAVYRLAQESVTNARRHARHATRIDVVIDVDEAGVHLNVSDDGDAGPATSSGYGITGMTERAALLGGTLQAGRSPGGGWLVSAVLPRVGWTT
jgi:signal transduction histidine kinase